MAYLATCLVGGLEHVFFHILGMSQSQLTKSIIFQRSRSMKIYPLEPPVSSQLRRFFGSA